jgi:hypothetical protein
VSLAAITLKNNNAEEYLNDNVKRLEETERNNSWQFVLVLTSFVYQKRGKTVLNAIFEISTLQEIYLEVW